MGEKDIYGEGMKVDGIYERRGKRGRDMEREKKRRSEQ